MKRCLPCWRHNLVLIYPQQQQAIIPFSGTPDVINIRQGTENINGKSTPIFQYGPWSKKLSLAGIPSIGTRPLIIDTIALHISPRALIIK
ncbi:MAG: hypothetical protein KC505_04370 [Myxococcales bacterium]|nr:hypothetical protein [Myxococcales bacterium]USN51214.1 MAG: hypothetical protein H6731_02045 [Myxococcales bacterium]